MCSYFSIILFFMANICKLAHLLVLLPWMMHLSLDLISAVIHLLLQLDSLNLCVSCSHTALRVIHVKITLFHLCFVFSSDQNMSKFFKALCYWISFLRPSGRAIHVPQISTQIYGGIPSDHPCGNCLMISLRKFGEMEGNFLYGYFRLLSLWKFPSCFPKKFQNAI